MQKETDITTTTNVKKGEILSAAVTTEVRPSMDMTSNSHFCLLQKQELNQEGGDSPKEQELNNLKRDTRPIEGCKTYLYRDCVCNLTSQVFFFK
jgi:hypothetical protein